MPSPFPGMDPYIEARREWSDFHVDLATELRTVLNTMLATNYYAVTTTYATYDIIQVAQQDRRSISPDVSVWQITSSGPSPAGVAVIDPPTVRSRVPLEVEVRIANVEVHETGTDRLVTAIEILSPVNKRTGPQRDKYLRKRRELFNTDVHVIEVDLLRGGQRSPLEITPPLAAYYISLGRAGNRPTVDVWAIQLWERLPRIPVPLLYPDPDVVIDLGAIVNAVYERGAYSRRLDYTQSPPPPELSDKELQWVDELLLPYRTQG
ncbi:MAG: DUF4058 family protein [Caldilineaceae bacterium]